MKRRRNRRRLRNLHDGRAPNDRLAISASVCKALLDDGRIDGIDRLLVLCAFASGDVTLSLSELRAEVCTEAIKAGGVGEAIKRREILLR